MIKLDLSDASHPVNLLITKFQTVMMASLEPKLQMLEMLLNKEPAKLLDVDSNRLTRMTQSLNLRMSKMKPKSSFNSDRFEGMPSETVFAEVLLLEVQQAVGFIYGSLFRFYMPVLAPDDLEKMREDLIETVTTHVVSG